MSSSRTPHAETRPASAETLRADALRVLVLKSRSFGDWERKYGGLPQRVDHLRSHGVRLAWSDAAHEPPWSRPALARAARLVERAGTLDLLLSARELARCDAVLAMQESPANALAWARARGLPAASRPALAVMAIWLAQRLPGMASRERRRYARAYGTVDRLLFFSSNQRDVYRECLGLSGDSLRFVPFGADDEFFTPAHEAQEEDFVLSVGRDAGRDWPTLFDAVRGTGMPVRVLCRPQLLDGCSVPDNVDVLGFVDRLSYRDLLRRARVVALSTRELRYPGGQSVLLEAMATGKCCVVTRTDALRDYLPGDAAIPVPPGDASTMRDALLDAFENAALRRTIGDAALAAVATRFNLRRMWAQIAEELYAAAAERR